MVATVVLMACAGAFGVLAALTVTMGLPYDEPSHWSNVLFILEHGRLPVLGEPGVTYEGQQTPLYYLSVAGLARLVGESLFAVRLLGVLGLIALTGLTSVIVASTARRGTIVIVAATAFIAFNPMLIVMSASVQNDTWALVWGFVAIAVSLNPVRGPRWLTGLAVGIAATLAILTKVSMAPLLIALVIAYVLRRRLIEPIVAVAVVGAGTSWWFVRNLILYDDLTGQSAVELTGAVFENVPAGPVELMQRILTYLTLPTEYLRNTIAAPAWVDATALYVGVVLLVGLVLLAVREWRGLERWGLLVVCVVAAVSFAAWIIQSQLGWPVAFRTAYAALPLCALAAGTATRVFRARWVGPAVLATTSVAQLAAGIWVVNAILSLDPAPML